MLPVWERSSGVMAIAVYHLHSGYGCKSAYAGEYGYMYFRYIAEYI